jgi:hypothetical protein
MISHQTEERLLTFLQVVLMLASICLAVVVPIWAAYTSWKVEKECLSLGYRESKRPFFSEGYCIIRLDQTDVVVPLPEARSKGRAR